MSPDYRAASVETIGTFDTALVVAPSSALIIKAEPLSNILLGRKTWEMRPKSTKKRERIGLIRQGSSWIVGVATISRVEGPLSDAEIYASEHKHLVDRARFDNDVKANKRRYAGVLTDVHTLSTPVPYKPRTGAVQFVSLNEQERRDIQRALRET